MDAFYERLDEDRFASTGHTSGPWNSESQHLGPPSALLVRALERCAPRPEMLLSRVVFEVLGPVPVAELTVTASVERPGRSVELLTAELAHDGRPVLRARAWRIVVGDTAAVASGTGEPPASPLGCAPMVIPEHWQGGYLNAMEWRSVSGSIFTPGDAVVWARAAVRVVAGEEPSATQRLFTVADSASGVSSRLDIRTWYSINTDLTVHLHREPVGEWFALEAQTVIGPSGVGMATSVLHDERGPVGRSAQSLFVRER
ncbi:TesB-like acyl-CoA thioesterase 5 [Saccharothrix sp. ALI-22-I]|uniref:thioesterase family protein n=1 Tax=Saccharothrix sp. ALI-22-I TaxID=1933778 RepID=UPI00097C0048|nr:thioesterase family protein [Saccharothrix sp. ALI-22-I]ONI85192.1 TesB-like acyl-CoA thioesterase 5 [Saccharothrix sp. ALI-22-I]